MGDMKPDMSGDTGTDHRYEKMRQIAKETLAKADNLPDTGPDRREHVRVLYEGLLEIALLHQKIMAELN